MDSIDADSPALSDLSAAVCADSAVEFAVAFGSRVSGTPTESSDLDLAVQFAEGVSGSARFEKRCFLSGDLQSEGRPFVDVADIESLPLEVAHDAVDGVCLCGDREAFERFKRATEAAFDDRRETLRRRRRSVIDRIAEDGLRG